jgi:hypothetical protein
VTAKGRSETELETQSKSTQPTRSALTRKPTVTWVQPALWTVD